MDEPQRARFLVALKQAKHGAKSLFAAAAGVDTSAVRKWQAGISDPAFTSFADGCAALGISLDWIAYGTSAPAIGELELAIQPL